MIQILEAVLKKVGISILAALLTMAVVSQADLVLEWDFAGLNGDEASVAATTIGPTMQGGLLTRGLSLSPATAANSFGATGWSGFTLDPDKYFQFTITPNAGYQYSINTLSYQVEFYDDLNGPHTWHLRSDDDNFTADLHQWSEWTSGVYSQSVDLSGNAAFQNVSDTTTFRIYGYDVCSGTPVASLTSSSPGIQIEGTMGVVPEPTTMVSLLLGALICSAYVFRKRV